MKLNVDSGADREAPGDVQPGVQGDAGGGQGRGSGQDVPTRLQVPKMLVINSKKYLSHKGEDENIGFRKIQTARMFRGKIDAEFGRHEPRAQLRIPKHLLPIPTYVPTYILEI